MARELEPIAARLFEGVMAPLVLGGALLPGHAIGGRLAVALGARGAEGMPGLDPDLADLVQAGRVRRARRLAPIDTLPEASAGDWTLAAALHDVLLVTHPGLDGPWRRSAAARVLDSAAKAIERVAPPRDVGEALARHTLFERLLEIRRTDTEVSWWTGSKVFRGVDPPTRLQAWPELRRVQVVATPRPLLELTPLAVDRAQLAAAVAALLERTPLTDVATCGRTSPPFRWSDAAVALLAQPAGRTLALRALSRQPAMEVDEGLGRATRRLPGVAEMAAHPVLELLGQRALEAALHPGPAVAPGSMPPDTELARRTGAAAARRALQSGSRLWPGDAEIASAALEGKARR